MLVRIDDDRIDVVEPRIAGRRRLVELTREAKIAAVGGIGMYACTVAIGQLDSPRQIVDKHSSPFTYFSSADLHLGEISLECSRPGAAAVALWATQRLFPLVKGGEFSAWLDRSLVAAREFWQRLRDSASYQPLMHPELDIVVYAVDAATSAESSRRARAVFERAADRDLHLALIELPSDLVGHYVPGLEIDSNTVTCLRSVMMKPEQLDWLDRIMDILEDCAGGL